MKTSSNRISREAHTARMNKRRLNQTTRIGGLRLHSNGSRSNPQFIVTGRYTLHCSTRECKRRVKQMQRFMAKRNVG